MRREQVVQTHVFGHVGIVNRAVRALRAVQPHKAEASRWGATMKHSGPNLSRHDYLVERVPHGAALEVIARWHYAHGGPNTGQTFGLFARADYPLAPLLGAALWLPPTRRAAEVVAGDEWNGVLSLSRLVVAPDLPRNAATFLLAATMRQLDRDRWPVLVTYADTRHGHTGAIYKATGWQLHGTSTTGSYWVTPDGRQLSRKRGRRNLTHAELRDAGATEHRSTKLRFTHLRSGVAA